MYPILRTHAMRLMAFGIRLINMPWRFWFPRKYKRPSVVTSFPGPKTLEFLNSVTPFTKDADTIEYVLNYKKCRGNYFCDIDNNVILDLNGQDGTLPLGYNDKAMVKLLKKGTLDPYQINNVSLYMYPNIGLHEMIQNKVVAQATPKGLEKALFVEGPASSAVELAVRMAILSSGKKDAQIAVLSGAIHGNASGNLVAAALNKKEILNIKKLELPFPTIKYPLDDNKEENYRLEAECVEQIRAKLSKAGPVAAIIVSPMQFPTYYSASDEFYKAIRTIARANYVLFMVDETRTGCGATGPLWAHNAWNLDVPADVVIFGGKTQVSGVFFNPMSVRVQERDVIGLAQGSPINVAMFAKILETIKKQKLNARVQDTGAHLLKWLKDIAFKSGKQIENIRGKGTLVAFDTNLRLKNVDVYDELRKKGIYAVRLSERTIGIRPSLTLTKKEANTFLDAMQQILQ